MTRAIASTAAEGAAKVWSAYSLRDRILLFTGAVASYWIFAGVASLFSIPWYRDYQASLTGQPAPALALLVAAVVLLGCVVLTSLFAGLVHFEGGLFCAALGMLALSARGGPMRYVLMYSPGDGVFLRLIFETLTLFAFVFAGWLALGLLRDRGLLEQEHVGDTDVDAIPAQGAMATATQVVIMILLLAVLAPTDDKAQVVWAVAIASLLGALGAHSLFPARPSIWFWMAPMIVAVLGYALAWSGGNRLPGGQVGGYAPALARPLPLDYAAIGTAGSLLGYWTSRRWQHEADQPENPEEVEDTLEHPPTTA
ncbi:MAG TPA: hypothetical protein VER17_15240 [Tepidisphaeraceae bacterium]|nr:hypothetical protein [Tepidisphaeraceae bacterium]